MPGFRGQYRRAAPSRQLARPVTGGQGAGASVPVPSWRRPREQGAAAGTSAAAGGTSAASAASRARRPAVGCAGGVVGRGPVLRARRSVMRPVSRFYLPNYRGWSKVRRRDTTEAIVGAITGTLARPQVLVLGPARRHWPPVGGGPYRRAAPGAGPPGRRAADRRRPAALVDRGAVRRGVGVPRRPGRGPGPPGGGGGDQRRPVGGPGRSLPAPARSSGCVWTSRPRTFPRFQDCART